MSEKKKRYHKSVIETAKVLHIMARSNHDEMIAVASKFRNEYPPSDVMAVATRGKKFFEMEFGSLEFVYTGVEGSKMNIHYRMVAKCCLYERMVEDNSIIEGLYDTPMDAILDFTMEELKTIQPYLDELVNKPMLVKNIKGIYDARQRLNGVYEDDERSEKDTSGSEDTKRLENNESVSNTDEEQVEEWE